MMTTIVKVLRICGYWSRPEQSQVYLRATVFFVAYLVWVTLPTICYMFRQNSDFLAAMKAAMELVVLVRNLAHLNFGSRCRPVLEEIFGEIESALEIASRDPNEDVQAMLRHLDSSAEKVVKIYLRVELIFTPAYCILPTIFIVIEYAITGTAASLDGVFPADYVLFDYQSSFWIWLPVNSISIVLIIYLVVCLIPLDSFNWCLLYHISCLFKIVGLKISKIDSCPEGKRFREQLAEIVSLQRTAYSCTDKLESVLNLLMFQLYGICILTLCMTMVVVTVAQQERYILAKMIIVLFFFGMQIFSYSMLGTELTTASTSVADAIYGTCWYDRTIPEQRSLLIMLVRSQKETGITAGKFIIMCRRSFAGAINSSYSYFTVLKQTLDA